MGKGLYQILNGKSQLLYEEQIVKEKSVVHIFEQQGVLHLMMEDASVYRIINGKIIRFSELQFENKVTVYSAEVLKDGSLLLGTISSGMISCNIDGSVNYGMNQNSGLGNNTGLSVFQDSKSNVWLGLDNGISCVNQESAYLIYKDRDGTLGTVYASARFGDRIYLGTNQGLFSKSIDQDNFVFIQGSAGQVWSLDIINQTLFCSHNQGLFSVSENRLDRIHNKGTWKIIPYGERDDLLLAGSYEGLYTIEIVNNRWQFRSNIDGFEISSKDIVLASDRKVFVNHEYKGVFRLELNESLNTIKSKSLVPELSKGIGSDIVLYDDRVFFAKRDSVFIKKQESDFFSYDSTLSNLFDTSSFTSASMIVAGDYLWTFNDNYIHRIEFEDINGDYRIDKIKYPRSARKEKIGYENLSMISPDRYLIGSSFGYSSFSDSNTASQTNTQIFITSVHQLKDNELINLSLTEQPTIDFEGSNIHISYAVANYNALQKNEFQHRLWKDEAVLNDWNEPSTETHTAFEGLGYGDYQFEVRSILNPDDSSESVSYNFTIGRPYYLTNTAIVIYVILTIVLVALLNGFYIWYFKRQKKRALLKQQKELELQNITNEKNIIELRNAKLRSDIEHRNRELAVSTMAMIKKNETLNELKTELQKLPKDKATSSLKKMLDKNLNSKQDWITFEEAFNNADKDFFKKIKERHPSLSSGDLRLCVYLRLNLSSKEIAPLLNISPRSVEIKRYRLRKKLGLTRSDSLTSYIVEI